MGDLYWLSLANSLMDYDWCNLLKCNCLWHGVTVLWPGCYTLEVKLGTIDTSVRYKYSTIMGTGIVQEQEDVDEVDTIAYAPEESDDEPFNMAIDDTSKDPTIVMGKPVTTASVSVDVCVPTEKVGCLQVTGQLKEFLKHFPPESKEKAFEQIYQILQALDAYLIDNPQQHLYCMSPDSEYVSLIMYATKIGIDLSNFPAIWSVLSTLLDTQSNELQHVKNLQQLVDDYYDKCPTMVMSRLEHQITDIMNAMYDSVNNDNFDSISDYTDSFRCS